MKAIELYNNTRIAYYSNVNSKTAQSIITLSQFKDAYKNENGTRIEGLRQYAKEKGVEFKTLKAMYLSGFTMSSSATTKASAEDAIFNHILCVDFDHVAQSEVMSLLKTLWKRQDVIMITKSVSGDGIYALVYVAHHVSRLKECLECFINDLPFSYRAYVDTKCSNANRFRFDADFQQSWKPDDYEVVPFCKSRPVEFKFTNFKTNTRFNSYANDNNNDEKKVERIIKKMLNCSELCVYDYNDWYALLKHVYGAFGESGEDYARRLSMSAPNFSERDFEKKWKRVCSEPSGGLNMGYWVNIAKAMKELNIN